MVVWCTSTGIVCSYCLLNVVDLFRGFRGTVNIVHLSVCTCHAGSDDYVVKLF
jgi:hypothetical protein